MNSPRGSPCSTSQSAYAHQPARSSGLSRRAVSNASASRIASPPASTVTERDAFQHARSENFVQLQPVQMNVADVTSAGVVRAEPLAQALLEVRVVNIADRFLDEVAPPRRAVTVNGNHARPGPTWFAAARVVRV